MKDLLYRLLGRSSLLFDPLRALLTTESISGRRSGSGDVGFDRTGLVVSEARPLRILWDDQEVLFAEYTSLAHSLWRAQELSLLRQYRNLLARPLVDFGTGDGSFASVLFDVIDYGVDTDPEALALAREYRIYDQVIQCSHSSIPLPSSGVGSVFSNSVLEHVTDLDAILSELHRILREDGVLVFTVPLSQFQDHLAKYFGTRASERVSTESSHRNVLSAGEWTRRLSLQGFEVASVHPYQPDWFTFWYRMARLVGPRGLGRLFPHIRSWIWRRYGTKLVEMVRTSIKDTTAGANVLVVARKRGEARTE